MQATENIAAKAEKAMRLFLERRGMDVLESGVDLSGVGMVAREDDVICFIKVNLAADSDGGFPEGKEDRGSAERSAAIWLMEHDVEPCSVRFDTLSMIVLNGHRAFIRTAPTSWQPQRPEPPRQPLGPKSAVSSALFFVWLYLLPNKGALTARPFRNPLPPKGQPLGISSCSSVGLRNRISPFVSRAGASVALLAAIRLAFPRIGWQPVAIRFRVPFRTL